VLQTFQFVFYFFELNGNSETSKYRLAYAQASQCNYMIVESMEVTTSVERVWKQIYYEFLKHNPLWLRNNGYSRIRFTQLEHTHDIICNVGKIDGQPKQFEMNVWRSDIKWLSKQWISIYFIIHTSKIRNFHQMVHQKNKQYWFLI